VSELLLTRDGASRKHVTHNQNRRSVGWVCYDCGKDWTQWHSCTDTANDNEISDDVRGDGEMRDDLRGDGEMRDDVRGDVRGDVRDDADVRGDVRDDADVRDDERGDVRDDVRGDADERGDVRDDERGDVRDDERGDVRDDERGDVRGDADERGDVRDDVRGDADERGDVRDDVRDDATDDGEMCDDATDDADATPTQSDVEEDYYTSLGFKMALRMRMRGDAVSRAEAIANEAAIIQIQLQDAADDAAAEQSWREWHERQPRAPPFISSGLWRAII
jgi:hypothetical protein